MMQIKKHLTLALASIMFSLLVLSCEEAFIPENQFDVDELVVEGYVQSGDENLPTYVLLTRALPFYAEIGQDEFEDLFVRDAHVQVDDGLNTVELTPFCMDELDEDVRNAILDAFGLEPGGIGEYICIYLDLQSNITREIGREYHLKIETEDLLITSSTTIPTHVPIDSFRWAEPPGTPKDSLAQLFCWAHDPVDEENFYRYLTAINDGPFNTGFGTVGDDAFFNGLNFEFSLDNQTQLDDEFDSETYGLYLRGDTVSLRWMNIDEDHFHFWNTLEYDQNNQGPFSSYTRASSNVNGALGIWGGYSNTLYTLVVPEK